MNSNPRAIRPLLIVGIASLAIVASSGCNWFKNKTHYQDSKETSPLEVPPDLDKPDTSAATSLPTGAGAGVVQQTGTGFGHLSVPVSEAYPKIGDILNATPGVVVNGRAEALSSYDVTYKGESFLLRVLDATGGSRVVALSPDGRMLNSGSAAELMVAIRSKF